MLYYDLTCLDRETREDEKELEASLSIHEEEVWAFLVAFNKMYSRIQVILPEWDSVRELPVDVQFGFVELEHDPVMAYGDDDLEEEAA